MDNYMELLGADTIGAIIDATKNDMWEIMTKAQLHKLFMMDPVKEVVQLNFPDGGMATYSRDECREAAELVLKAIAYWKGTMLADKVRARRIQENS